MYVLILAVTLGGCATTARETNGPEQQQGPSTALVPEHDPWERFNRSMYNFNDKVDRAFVRPVAKGYRKVLPAAARRSVGNFFRNLYEPTTIINDILQGKFGQAGSDFGRLVVNSTIGILGLFDVATEWGIERHEEDFGQTLAVWGIKPGPYLVLPFLGPSNIRDGIGLVPYYYLTDPRLQVDDFAWRIGLIAVDVIDTRSQLLTATKVLDMQLDPYVFTRESYRQRRLDQIFDGNPPLEEEFR